MAKLVSILLTLALAQGTAAKWTITQGILAPESAYVAVALLPPNCNPHGVIRHKSSSTLSGARRPTFLLLADAVAVVWPASCSAASRKN